MKKTLVLAFLIALGGLSGWAQRPDVAAILGYPQLIIYNAKIVTMDDDSFQSQVGTIVQAMAIRDGKILYTGSNAAVQDLAGPQTKKIDLKGRTVLPSFMLTHEHLTEWAFIEPRAMTHAWAPNPDDVIVARWMPNVTPKEQLALFEPTLKEALSKAKPGQWILIVFNWGPDYEQRPGFGGSRESVVFRDIKKQYLDTLAPNNPVKVYGGFVGAVVNQKAIDALKDTFSTLNVILNDDEIDLFEHQGLGMSRPMNFDVMLRYKWDLAAALLKAEFDWWASWGMTGFGTAAYSPGQLQVLSYMDRKGELDVRFGWSYAGPDFSEETLRHMAGMVGHGTDHLWLLGAQPDDGGPCRTIPVLDEWKNSPNYTGPDRCTYDRGTPLGAVNGELLKRMVANGLRISTLHTGGDKDVDLLINEIEAGAKEGKLTLDEIRAMRFSFDHSEGAPRPDQIPRLKNLGMLVSQNNTYFWEPGSGTAQVERKFGVEYTGWMVPRKSLTEAGVKTGFEIDRPLAHKIFYSIHKGMTREHPDTKRVYAAGEKTDRIIQLKALTSWAAYILLREKVLGTLEPGKFADFIVLDKDYLTIPDDQIPSIRVLMTVVGGKTVHLTAPYGREIGMSPVGYTTWTEKLPPGWGD